MKVLKITRKDWEILMNNTIKSKNKGDVVSLLKKFSSEIKVEFMG